MIKNFFAPSFGTEIKRFCSTIPVLSSVVEILVTLYGVLLTFGLMGKVVGNDSSVKGGGLFGLIFVIIYLGLILGIGLSFVFGFFYSIYAVFEALLLTRAGMISWVSISLLGIFFKNTSKVKFIGKERKCFESSKLYVAGFILTIPIVLLLLKGIHDGHLAQAEVEYIKSTEWFFLILGVIASVIFVFHGFIKPLITSLHIIFVRFFIRSTESETEGITLRSEKIEENFSRFRKVVSTLRIVALSLVACVFAVFYLLVSMDAGCSFLAQFLYPLEIESLLGVVNFYFAFFSFALVFWFIFSSILTPEKVF